MKPYCLLFLFLLSGCNTTQQSVGTSPFKQAIDECAPLEKTDAELACMRNHPEFSRFTDAEKQIVAYLAVIAEKIRRGEISETEGEYLAVQYAAQARSLGNASEQARAQQISSALGKFGQSMSSIAEAEQNRINSLNAASRQIPLPTRTRCWQNGMYVNCTSY